MESESEPAFSEMEIFKDALMDENATNQLEAVKRLPSLASALGVSQTLQDLLPVLSDCVEVMHDEALYKIPDQLANFLPLIGGSENASIVLNILVKLSTNDETLVRTNAVEAMKEICEALDGDQCQKLFYPVIEDLTHNDWFTTKCSASGLFAICYEKMDQEKRAELRNMFRNLVQDESPMVRRAAENGLVDFIKVLEVEHVEAEFLPVFHNLAMDPQDSVRVLAIDVGIAIARKIDVGENFENFILPTIKQLSVDSSWRVRQKVAQKIAEIQSVSDEKTANEILIIFQTCTKDDEAEVRAVAAENIYSYAHNFKKAFKDETLFEKTFQEELMPPIHRTMVDEHEQVRLALSTNILSLSTVLSGDCFNVNILPLILDALEHDESMPFKENLLKNLNSLPLDVDIAKSFTSLGSVLENLINNSKLHWRTRRNVLVALVRIVKTATIAYFDENIKRFYIHLLNDSVYAVRQTACLIMPLLITKFGYNWAREALVPVIKLLAINPNYVFRRMSLFAINELIFPTLDKNDPKVSEKYLEIYRNKDPEILAKILILVVLLKEKIERVKNKHPDDDDDVYGYFTFNDDSKLYGEDTLEALKDTQIRSIFTQSDDDNDAKEVDYLQGILLILNQDLLEIVDYLIQDNVENIKCRAKFTLEQVGKFCTVITYEQETSEWVETALGKVNEETKSEMRSEIEKILTKSVQTISTPNSVEQLDLTEIEVEEPISEELDVPASPTEVKEKLEEIEEEKLEDEAEATKPEDDNVSNEENVTSSIEDK